MTEKETSPAKPAKLKRLTHIKDARGRKVTQADPVALYLLHQHDVIEEDVLRAIVSEEGVRVTRKQKQTLLFSVFAVLIIGGFLVRSLIVESFGAAPYARTSSIIYLCFLPWFIWHLLRRARFRKVAAAMLKYHRCPHCGYDLRMLPVDPQDGATVCPECGCAWKLDDRSEPVSDVPHAEYPSSTGDELDE
ncbi:MAG: TFIIB-type zinc ribbon-containing protein [Phycisphaerales bacterium]|nr:MAG: TFIIB-type zinc ribbon-containing protein [Phycisphaerales bacterium]